MSSWILLAIIGQFINSIVAVIDKFLVTSKKVPNPSLYVFYTGILVVFSLMLYCFDLFLGYWIADLPSFGNVTWLSSQMAINSMLPAGFMLFGLYFLFKALVKADASDIFPVVGSISSFFVLMLSYLYFNQILHTSFFFGFIFLAVGTLFVSHFRFDRSTFYSVIAASILLSFQSVLLKKLFNDSGFDNGFFWYSAFIFIFALFMLFSKNIRKSFIHHRKSANIKSTDKIIVVGKILAGIGGMLTTIAINLGNVTIVQALTGLQYLFLFLFAVILGKRTHSDWGENVTKKDIVQKTISITLILIGFVLLFI